jgi:phosphoserine phosphatase
LTTVVDSLLSALETRNRDEPLLAVFDCDGTLIKGDIGEAMLYRQLEQFLLRVSPATVWPDYPHREELHGFYEQLAAQPPTRAREDQGFGIFTQRVLAWYFDQLAEGKTAKACADIVRLCAGFSAIEIRQIAEETAAAELHAPEGTRTLGAFPLPRGIRFIEESLTLLNHVRSLAADVWVVSGSNRWSVEAIMRRLQIPLDHILGIDLIAADGKLSSAVRNPIPVLEGKVEALVQLVGRRPDIVVSDSIYDIPLFRHSAGFKLLINSNERPSSEFFASGKVSRDDSWFVIETPTLRS